jgi:hypothetical protein
MISRFVSGALGICLALVAGNSWGAIVTFDLRSTSGQAGAAFRDGATSFSLGGVTLSHMASPGSYFALADNGGVNTSESGNQRARINASNAESVVFTISAINSNIVLSNIDFNLVDGTTSADAAIVSINGAAPISLFTGITNFNGTTDVWSPNIQLASGSTIAISAASEIGLQGITFDVTAVPEPSSLALLTVCGVAGVIYRRRAVSQVPNADDMSPSQV